MDAPTVGWWKAKDGSWHPHRLIDVRCPHCGLEGGAPVGSDQTACPSCGTTFEIFETEPTAQPTREAAPEPTQDRSDPTPARGPERTPFSTTATPPSAKTHPGGGWAGTCAVVAVAFVVVVVGAISGRPDPAPALATMHFCTSGSAPTVNLKMTIGASGPTSLTNVPNGHCAVNEKFITGSNLKVAVWNSTGVGEVACSIVRNGRQISTDRSTLRAQPATCSGRA
jgi:hypothetical protein